jgi:hypothetical protein
MVVLDHEPQWWFLLQDGDRLLFDVNCSHSAVSYSWLMELNPGEVEKFRASGRAFLGELAEAIQWSAPGVRGSTSQFLGRNISQACGKAVTGAVEEWRSGGGGRNA